MSIVSWFNRKFPPVETSEDYKEWKKGFDTRCDEDRRKHNDREFFCTYTDIVSITKSSMCVKDKCRYWNHTGFGYHNCCKKTME